jgi:hypothetical protein
MLSCSVWFSAPCFWMGGGLESRCVGRVYGADGTMAICSNSTSNAPDDGRMYPKHVEAKNTSIKLPCCIKLAFHIISCGRCTVKKPSNNYLFLYLQAPFVYLLSLKPRVFRIAHCKL